jgi:hypothetical protein
MARHKLTAAERRKGQRARRKAAKQKAREAPRRLKEIEKQMDAIERKRRAAADPEERASLIREIAALGTQRREYQQ